MEWFEKLAQIKKASGKTHEELSVLSGVPKSTIDKLFSNVTKNPPYATVEKIINALGYSVDALSTPIKDSPILTTLADNLTKEQREYVEKYFELNLEGRERVHSVINFEYAKQQGEKKTVTKITQPSNVVDLPPPETLVCASPWPSACAGKGNYLDDNVEYDNVTILKNRYTDGADLIIKLQGDSMEPEFHDGDQLLVTSVPYGTHPRNGRVGIFIVDGDAFLRQPLNGALHPYNEKYEDITPNEYTDVRYVGYVIGTLDDSWVLSREYGGRMDDARG